MLHLYLTSLSSSFYTRKCMQVPSEQEASNVLFLFNDMPNTSLPCLIFALTVKLFHPSSPASPETLQQWMFPL